MGCSRADHSARGLSTGIGSRCACRRRSLGRWISRGSTHQAPGGECPGCGVLLSTDSDCPARQRRDCRRRMGRVQSLDLASGGVLRAWSPGQFRFTLEDRTDLGAGIPGDLALLRGDCARDVGLIFASYHRISPLAPIFFHREKESAGRENQPQADVGVPVRPAYVGVTSPLLAVVASPHPAGSCASRPRNLSQQLC